MDNNYFQLLSEDLKKLWAGLELPQKAGLLIFVVLTIVLSVYFLTKSMEPDWATLYSELNVQDAAKITESLKKNGYKYKLSEDKKTIFVPSKNKDELRIFVAENDLIDTEAPGFELLDEMQLGSTEFKNKMTKQRIFQGEITRSIEKMTGIKSVRVQLADPERSIFEEKDELPTASVMLILETGYRLKASQVKAIKNLVAYSVPRMTPDRVFITDQFGNSLSEETGKNSNDMESFKSNVELETSKKIVSVLEKIVGKGNVSVQVNTDIDFNSTKATIESYIPVGDNGKGVLTSVQSEVESYENPNQTPVNANVNARNLNYSKEKNATNYSVSKEVKQIVYAPGTIKRMTIAVAVNKILTDPEKDELRNLVLSASGANYDRGDVITISSLQFEALAQEEAEKAESMKQIQKESTIDYFTTKIAPLLVMLILGLTALIIIRNFINKDRSKQVDVLSPSLPQFGTQLPTFVDEAPDLVLSETLPSIEARLDPEIERIRVEINNTILANPAEAARLLVSYIKEQ